ncbi:aromatic ring-hydroxylating dioxygenase subunit alpha [Pseudonocardia yuanmonensis]|uniref:Aromatic ring-hydroxylating dioxygenase subunit alpha n=1 Tax=Pseudonocardia yuanmonensis TaxID=1095914 RepID=A0ABP8X9B2_9PSEU
MAVPPRFPRDQWYVAALSDEVGPTLLARTVLNEPLVLHRTAEGTVSVLADRCVHRRYPLSKGTLTERGIVCGYHGFTYDDSGLCTAVPGQSRVPRTARVSTYPVVEQDTMVWVFIGDPDLADPAAIPRVEWLSDPAWTSVRSMAPLAARAGLLLDNLMDLSHETFLHAAYIGSPEVAETPIVTTVDDTTGVVRVERRMSDAECPPAYQALSGLDRISRWQDIEYHPPGLYLLHIRIAPPHTLPAADGSDPGGFRTEVLYAITPETDRSTHDFWIVGRSFELENPELDRRSIAAQSAVVQQDVDALNLLEEILVADGSDYQELSVNLDTGGLAARRQIERLSARQSVPR